MGLSLSYTEKTYKIMYLIRSNMNLFEMVLLSFWMKQKFISFKNTNLKKLLIFLIDKNSKFNLEPRI